MLLVPIGSAARLLVFDATERQDCATCGAARDFQLSLRYEWGTLFWWPVCVTGRQYALACPVCMHGWVVERRSAEAIIGGDPVPWRHRNGWMVLAGVALVVAVAVARTRGLF
jgi:hypothetical protein